MNIRGSKNKNQNLYKSKPSFFKTSLLMLMLFIGYSFYFLLVGCTSSTSPKKASLSGVVSLVNDSGNPENDITDFSGITVSLYELAYLDTTVVRINREYPQIGVHINQHTEFDHRSQTPLYSTETNPDGSFTIKDISPGTYNFVAMKEGWGWRYIYEITLNEGDNSLSDVMKQSSLNQRSVEMKKLISDTKDGSQDGDLLLTRKPSRNPDISLFPEIHMPGDIDQYFHGNLVIEPFHHLVINDDVIFLDDSYFELQPNSVCRIAGSKSVDIYGSVKMQGEEEGMFWVTGEAENSIIGLFRSCVISANSQVDDNILNFGKVTYSNNNVSIEADNILVGNFIISDNNSGINFVSNENSIIKNCLAFRNSNASTGGIGLENSNSPQVKNNVLLNNVNGIYAKFCNEVTFSNNYILGNSIGILDFTVKGVISHNEIGRNTVCDIKLTANTITGLIDINYNNLKSDVGVWQYEQGSFNSFHLMKINYNNFYSKDVFIKYDSSGHSHYVNIDATKNYFNGINNSSLIKDMIIDTNFPYPALVIVVYEPFLNENILDAGIKYRRLLR